MRERTAASTALLRSTQSDSQSGVKDQLTLFVYVLFMFILKSCTLSKLSNSHLLIRRVLKNVDAPTLGAY